MKCCKGKAGLILFSLLAFFSSTSPSAVELSQFGTEGLSLRFREADTSIARVLLTDLERGRAEIATLLGVAAPGRITVYLSGSDEDFSDLTQGKIPHWGAGCAFPDQGVIVLRRLPGQVEALLRTARHEMAHILLHQAPGGAVPVWFDEGVAMWAARQWRFHDSTEVFRAVSMGGLIPLSEMGSVIEFSSDEAGLAYTECLLAVSYLIHISGRDAVARVIDRLSSGDAFGKALYRTTGFTEVQFEIRWTEFARKRFGPATLLIRTEALWIYMALLTLVAYLSIRVRSRRRLGRSEEEDDISALPSRLRLQLEDQETGR